MPNQRDKGKVFIGSWVKSRLAARVRRLAKHQNRPVSTVVDELLSAYADASSSTAPQELSDAAVSEAIAGAIAPAPASGPVSYGSPRKSARRSKAPRAAGSGPKGK